MRNTISPTKHLTLDTDSWMLAAARDLPKRPPHTHSHTHPPSSSDVSVVSRETCDREKWKIRQIQIVLLSEFVICGLFTAQHR